MTVENFRHAVLRRREGLREQITIDQAELLHTPDISSDVKDLRKPFGYLNAEWERLKAEMQPGDELWTFCSSDESWANLTGSEGIALVRDGTVIAEIVTCMN